MIKPSMHTQQINSTSRRGTWVVTVLVLMGLGAGLISLAYWTAQGRWIRERDEESQSEPAGSAAWDQGAADADLTQLQEWFNRVASEKKDTDEVLNAAKRLVERYPEYAPVRTLLGQILIYCGLYEAAYEQMNLSLELDGQQPEVQLLAGTLADKLGQSDRSLNHYLMAVGMERTNARFRLHLAQAYIKSKRFEEARSELLEAIRIDSSLHGAYALLADLYARQNKMLLALPQIQKAIEQTSISEPATRVIYIRRKAQLLRRNNKPNEALLTLQSLSDAQRADSRVMEEMATCWAMLGKPDKGAALFEQAMVLEPTRWDWVAQAARWRLKADDKKTARQHLAKLKQINPRAEAIAVLEAQLD